MTREKYAEKAHELHGERVTIYYWIGPKLNHVTGTWDSDPTKQIIKIGSETIHLNQISKIKKAI